jgi:hypothetical protein
MAILQGRASESFRIARVTLCSKIKNYIKSAATFEEKVIDRLCQKSPQTIKDL